VLTDSIPLLAGSALIGHNLLNDECFVCEHHIRGSAGCVEMLPDR
jgi:hypothetical protein